MPLSVDITDESGAIFVVLLVSTREGFVHCVSLFVTGAKSINHPN